MIEHFYRLGNIELTAEFSIQQQIFVRPPIQYR